MVTTSQRWRRIRLKIAKRQNNKCYYCSGDMILHPKGKERNSPKIATLDHCLEKRNGGTNKQTNLVVACYACNFERDILKLEPSTFKAMKGQKMTKAIEQLADGIYFGLDAEIYHGQHRIGSGGISNMLISPADFWVESWLNPDNQPDEEDEEQDEEQTKAQLLGTAYHCARLEPEHFESRYWAKPSKKDFPNALKTDTQIREQLKLLGEAMTKAGESVLDRALRLKSAGYPGQIFHIEMDKAEATRGDRTAIDRKYYDEITRDMERIKGKPAILKHLTGGMSEVTILWTGKDGVKRKARPDYLKPASWTDFKTFDNAQGKVLQKCITDAIQYNRYYIQAAYYFEAVEAVRTGGLKIIGKAPDEALDLIDAIKERTEPLECWYVFQEKNGIPNLLARRIRLFSDPHESHSVNEAGADATISADVAKMTINPTALHQKAKLEIKHAIGLFQFYMEEVGESEPWGPLEETGDIDDDSFNKYWLDGDR